MIIKVRSIMKSHMNSFRYTIFKLLCSTFIFPCTMILISNNKYFLSFKYLFSNFSLQIQQIFTFLYDSCSCLFSMLLNDDIVDIKKPDGICLLTFVVNEFSGLFLHPSIFSIIHSRSA